MPLVEVWKHPISGKLYEQKSAYVAALKKQARERYLRRHIRRRILALRKDFVDSVECFDDLMDTTVLRRHLAGVAGIPATSVDQNWFVVQIKAAHSERIPNTHNCPWNGVTNWGRKADGPTGYPGWQGRMDFWVRPELDLPDAWGITNILSDIGLKTGSGGMNHAKTGVKNNNGNPMRSKGSYEVYIFEDDFPKLAHQQMLVRIAR